MAKIVKISKEEANRRLGDVLDGKHFWCQDGKVVKNLKELGEALDGMGDETFHHHSGEGRNDFSNWIRDCIQDTALAKKLVKVTDKNQAREIVQERLDWLNTRA